MAEGEAVGRRVAVPNGRGACALGTVASSSRVYWEDGVWLGVIMDEPWRRHGFTVGTAGTVHGRRFFKCRPGLGVFVPEDAVLPEATALQYRGSTARDAARRFQSLFRRHRTRESVMNEIHAMPAYPSEFRVGAKATLHLDYGDEECTIRYIGATALGRGVWAGVELDKPGADANDGTAGTERLFKCEKGRGRFVRLAHLTVKRRGWALLAAALSMASPARMEHWGLEKTAPKSFASIAVKVAAASAFVKKTAALPKNKRDVAWQDSAADRHSKPAAAPSATGAVGAAGSSELTPPEAKVCARLRDRMLRTRGSGAAAWKGVWAGVRDREGEAMVGELADMLRARGALFRDPDFPADDRALFMDPSKPAKFHPEFLTDSSGKRLSLAWKRPTEFGDITAVPRVFSEGIDPDDIHQGILGDCYFLAAIAGCAKRNMLIEDLVVEDHEDVGLYGVKFFREGAWVTVVIDDLFPCYKQGSQWMPVFSRYGRSNSREKETWCMIMEKAWAKLHGSFEACIAGDTIDALGYLTGGTTTTILLPHDTTDKKELEEVWSSAQAISKRDPFMATEVRHTISSAVAKTKGLISDHAYSVLALKDTSAGIRLVKCRNPWGEFEWSGDFSDNSRLWTDALKREIGHLLPLRTDEGDRHRFTPLPLRSSLSVSRLHAQVGYVNSDDGSFWMSFRDFVAHFENIGACLPLPLGFNYASIRGSWAAGSTAGGYSPETFQFNPTYAVECDEGHVTFTVAQRDVRGTDLPFLEFKLFVFRNPTGPLKPTDAALTIECHRRTASAETAVRRGRHERLVCVVAAWGAGVEGTFWLTVSSRSPVSVSQIVPPTPNAGDAERMKRVDSRIPLCLVCSKPVEGVFYGYPEGKCHADCNKRHIEMTSEKCHQCGEPLIEIEGRFSGLFYVVTQESVERKVHKECYDTFQEGNAPKCVHCKTTIREDKYKVFKDGSAVHERCFDAHAESLAPKCIQCSKAIAANDKFSGKFYRVLDNTQQVHVECYELFQASHGPQCALCFMPILDKSYQEFENGDTVHVRCEQNYVQMRAEKCIHCKGPLCEVVGRFSGSYYPITAADGSPAGKCHEECYASFSKAK